MGIDGVSVDCKKRCQCDCVSSVSVVLRPHWRSDLDTLEMLVRGDEVEGGRIKVEATPGEEAIYSG